MKNIKKPTALFIALLIAFSAGYSAPYAPFGEPNFGITANAADYTYIDENGDIQTVAEPTVIDSSTSTTWNTGWYVVNSDVTIGGRITINGDVKLILSDSYTLTASSGIHVTGTNKFTIYGQSSNSGKLIATAPSNGFSAGIGSQSYEDCGTIIINGGEITATGGQYGAGIGGGCYGMGGSITINGGKVEANGVYGGAGIGSGYGQSTKEDTSNITINGGTIIATSSKSGAAIGGGTDWASAGTININGGFITATGGQYGAGIGGGSGSKGGKITITNGTFLDVEAGSAAAGIGGGSSGEGGTIIISGGNFEKIKGSNWGAAIGGGSYSSGGNITITGGIFPESDDNFTSEQGACIGGGYGSSNGDVGGGEINIKNVTLRLKATSWGAGIGGGAYNSGGNINIENCDIKATGGNQSNQGAAGIGGGSQNGNGGNITIKNSKIEAVGSGQASGIGGGMGGSAGNITIIGCTIIATGCNSGSGIGGGGGCGQIIIEDCPSIIASIKDGDYGCGIGGGSEIEKISIKNSKVVATGNGGYAGIGTGVVNDVDYGVIEIINSNVTATSGGAGIGSGHVKDGTGSTVNGKIVIKDGSKVISTSNDKSAGIGGGYGHDGGTIEISGDSTEVVATGDGSAAGIGGGSDGSAGTITITGGDITANPGNTPYSGGLALDYENYCKYPTKSTKNGECLAEVIGDSATVKYTKLTAGNALTPIDITGGTVNNHPLYTVTIPAKATLNETNGLKIGFDPVGVERKWPIAISATANPGDQTTTMTKEDGKKYLCVVSKTDAYHKITYHIEDSKKNKYGLDTIFYKHDGTKRSTSAADAEEVKFTLVPDEGQTEYIEDYSGYITFTIKCDTSGTS